jgi:hypothetical protein
MSDPKRYSQYVHGSGDRDGPPLTPALAAFEDYLQAGGYELAAECCPIDNGEFMFATAAGGLVDDFLIESPEFESERQALYAHAGDIGDVSNEFTKADEENAEAELAAAERAEDAAEQAEATAEAATENAAEEMAESKSCTGCDSNPSQANCKSCGAAVCSACLDTDGLCMFCSTE